MSCTCSSSFFNNSWILVSCNDPNVIAKPCTISGFEPNINDVLYDDLNQCWTVTTQTTEFINYTHTGTVNLSLATDCLDGHCITTPTISPTSYIPYVYRDCLLNNEFIFSLQLQYVSGYTSGSTAIHVTGRTGDGVPDGCYLFTGEYCDDTPAFEVSVQYDSSVDCDSCQSSNDFRFYKFSACCLGDSNYTIYDASGIPQSLTDGDIYPVTVNSTTYCMTCVSQYTGSFVNDPTYPLTAGTITYTSYGDCSNCASGASITQCPSPTPTPTPTLTPTVTPTIPIINCNNQYYCFNSTNTTLSAYNGTYTRNPSLHNGKNYYTSGSYYVYWDTTKWCLSTALDGSCLVFGPSPCVTTCPNLNNNLWSVGSCNIPTPTPTPSRAFTNFNVVFDCDILITPSVTPTKTVTPTVTKTVTPSVTPTNPCGGNSFSLSVSTQQNTPTPTPSVTSTPEPTKIPVSGSATYYVVDSKFVCPGYTAELINCSDGVTTYYVWDTITYNGVTLQPGSVFKALIDNVETCVSFNTYTTQSTNVLWGGVVSTANTCTICLLPPSPTPTPTVTPTTSTPYFLFTATTQVTGTSTCNAVSYPYTGITISAATRNSCGGSNVTSPTSYDVTINYIETTGGGSPYFDSTTFTLPSGQLLYQLGTIYTKSTEDQGGTCSAVTRTITSISVNPGITIC
jgi:hypothetical protein